MTTDNPCPHSWVYPREQVRECWRCGAVEQTPRPDPPQDGELERAPRRYAHQQSGEIVEEGT